jgi:hypothetical protein
MGLHRGKPPALPGTHIGLTFTAVSRVVCDVVKFIPSPSFLVTVLASVLVLMTVEVVLGWDLDTAEKSLIVLIIFVITVATSKLMARGKRNGEDAKH